MYCTEIINCIYSRVRALPISTIASSLIRFAYIYKRTICVLLYIEFTLCVLSSFIGRVYYCEKSKQSTKGNSFIYILYIYIVYIACIYHISGGEETGKLHYVKKGRVATPYPLINIYAIRSGVENVDVKKKTTLLYIKL